jgi:hypothetical protein
MLSSLWVCVHKDDLRFVCQNIFIMTRWTLLSENIDCFIKSRCVGAVCPEPESEADCRPSASVYGR